MSHPHGCLMQIMCVVHASHVKVLHMWHVPACVCSVVFLLNASPVVKLVMVETVPAQFCVTAAVDSTQHSLKTVTDTSTNVKYS